MVHLFLSNLGHLGRLGLVHGGDDGDGEGDVDDAGDLHPVDHDGDDDALFHDVFLDHLASDDVDDDGNLYHPCVLSLNYLAFQCLPLNLH